MGKKMLIIAVIILFVTVGFSGCTQVSNMASDSNGEDAQYIIGAWINTSTSVGSFGEQTCMQVHNFTEEHTFEYLMYVTIDSEPYGTDIFGTYELKDGNIILTNRTMNPIWETTFRYSFSNNYRTLTLTDDSGISTVYTKI